MTLKSSNHNILSRQKSIVGEEVFKRQIKDTDDSLGLLATSLVGASTEEVSKIMSDATTAYTNLGVTKEEASSKLFDIFMSAKINAISSDDIMSLNFKQLKAEKDNLLKSFDPFLTGKDTDVKLNHTFEKLEKEQSRAVTEYLNDYARSETVSNKAFEAELNKYQHALKPIEIQNFKEAKADVLFRKAAREQAIADAKEAKLERIAMKDFSAMLHNPEVSIEDITARATTLKEKGILSQDEFDSYVAQSKERIETKKDTKLAKEYTQQKKEAGAIFSQIKASNKTVPAYNPEFVAGLVMKKTDGLPGEDDIKFINNYVAQYNIENNSQEKVKAINTPIYNYPEEVQGGVKKALENITNNASNYENFSAEAILKIHKNGGVKGNVVSKLSVDVSNPENAIKAVGAFNELVTYDANQAKALLGDTLFYQLQGLSTRIQQDPKTKTAMIPADDVRKFNDIASNPDSVPVKLDKFNDVAKDNPELFLHRNEYKTAIMFGADPDDVISSLEGKVKQKEPVPGIYMQGYKGTLSEDSIDKISKLPEYLNKQNSNVVGIAYNSKDNTFYYSSPFDRFSSKIEKVNKDGTRGTFNNIEDVYMYFNNKITNKIKDSTAYKIDTAIRQIPDYIKGFNPVYDKENDKYLFNEVDKQLYLKGSRYGNRPDGTSKVVVG